MKRPYVSLDVVDSYMVFRHSDSKFLLSLSFISTCTNKREEILPKTNKVGEKITTVKEITNLGQQFPPRLSQQALFSCSSSQLDLVHSRADPSLMRKLNARHTFAQEKGEIVRDRSAPSLGEPSRESQQRHEATEQLVGFLYQAEKKLIIESINYGKITTTTKSGCSK